MKRSKKLAFILLLMIFILTVSLKYIYLTGPVTVDEIGQTNYIRINLRSGTSGRQAARLLYENKLIRSEKLFYILLRLENKSLKAGTYQLSTAFDMHEIIDLITSGKVATFRVTIPEGFTVEEISERLAALTPYDKEDFLLEANKDFGRDYLKEANLPRKYLLEGFLYPDTYNFPYDFSPAQIMEHLLLQFENKWLERLEANYITDSNDSRTGEYSPFEIVTIASLIEKETKHDDEKTWISAVIYNRLEKDMLLQLDASVQYALKDRTSRVLYRDLEVDSLYNTYRYPGLPPGPIANPGSSSIEAALNPANKSYLFYFALSDGRHVFSHSYSEHLRLQNEMRD
ncbi:MAG: endolytic transglycosylase MltG [Halanaerobiaceae bacterium]